MTANSHADLAVIRGIVGRYSRWRLSLGMGPIILCVLYEHLSELPVTTLWVVLAFSVLEDLLDGKHSGWWKWACLRPIPTVRLGRLFFVSYCGMMLLPLAVGYVLYGAFGWLGVRQGHDLLLVTVMVHMPVVNGLVLTIKGKPRTFLVALGVVSAFYLAWVRFDAQAWMSPHVWNLFWLLMSAGLGYRVAIAGVTGTRQGADVSGRAIRNRPKRRFREGFRRALAFANAEDAEVWRQWRRLWVYCPIGLPAMVLVGVGFSAWSGRTVWTLGNLVFFASLGLLATVSVVGSGALGDLCVKELPQTRTLSVEALSRCMYRAAARGLLATAFVALVCAAAWIVMGEDTALVAAVRAHPLDSFIVVAYGAMAIWAATWTGTSRRKKLFVIVLAAVAVLVIAFGPLPQVVPRAGRFDSDHGPSLEEVFRAGTWITVIGGAVSYAAWAFVSARRRGVVSSGRCVMVAVVGCVLVASPLLHCPVWFGMWSVPARLTLVTLIVALALAPLATVPLACERARGGWCRIDYTDPRRRWFGGYSGGRNRHTDER